MPKTIFLQDSVYVRGEKTNKHQQLFGIVPGMGGGQICLCVAFFLGEKGKHINKIPRKSQKSAGTVPGQSRDYTGQSGENFVYVFCCLLVFSGPDYGHTWALAWLQSR